MQIQTNEARIILAIEAIQTSKKLSCRKAAKIYNIPETTLRDRMNGRTTLSERRPAVQKLTEMEEEIIVQYIFDQDSRGFSPRLTDVEDMANYLLDARRAKHIGKL
jgi:helix-turn-helix, Psq domain